MVVVSIWCRRRMAGVAGDVKMSSRKKILPPPPINRGIIECAIHKAQGTGLFAGSKTNGKRPDLEGYFSLWQLCHPIA